MESVKGFRDFTGIDAVKREKIREILIRNFKSYGFEPAETPIIENEEFVKSQGAGDEAISDVFKLQDKGKRKLALRYEFTFQLKRIANNKKLPYKRYQIGEVFRDEPVSGNRLRQFIQCDADIIGASIKDEAEILAMAGKILKEFGIQAEILVNNRKLLNEILDKQGIKAKAEVIKEIDKLDKLPEQQVKENLKKYGAAKLLDIFKKPESYFKKYKSYDEILELKKTCKNYGAEIKFSPSLARGLSYYNGTIFEIKTKDMKESICGGGSYLVNGNQACGISFGLERISSLAKIPVKEERIVIISINEDRQAIKLAEQLRKLGKEVIVMYGKPTKALEFANSYGISYVIFLGQEEAKKKKVKLRDMKTGKEMLISEEEVIRKTSGN
jgi:histidyl-tRNA synthetase